MTIQGAVIREQGQTFAVVIVKRHLLNLSSTANDTIDTFAPYFPGMPLVLAGQDHGGGFTYYGRKDLSAFLASISPSRIPWKKYHFG